MSLQQLTTLAARPELIEIAGQSNALGFGLDLEDLPAHLRQANGVTMIWTDAGWDLMRPGVNTGTVANPGAWGPEVEFAHDWHEAHPDQVLYVVKSVKGSTGIARDDNQLDWSPQSHGELFDAASARFQAALARLPNAHVTTLWMQGEQDAFDLGKARAYLGNARDLFHHMRADWSADQIVFGQISQPLPFVELVREAQAEMVDGRTLLVDTSGFHLQGDNLHFSADGQVQLGADLYAAAFGHLEPLLQVASRSIFESWAFA